MQINGLLSGDKVSLPFLTGTISQQANAGGGFSYLANANSILFEHGDADHLEASSATPFDIANGGTSFSISFWVKPTSHLVAPIVSKGGSYRAYTNYGGMFTFAVGTSFSSYSSTGGITLSTGSWQHIVCVYNGSAQAANAYKNGSVGTTFTSNLSSGTSLTNSNTFQIAASDVGTADPFLGSNYLTYNGRIDEVSFWDKALSSSEVTAIYNTGVPGDLSQHSAFSNLVSWYRMGEQPTDNLTADTGQVTDVVGANNLIPRNTTSANKITDFPT